MFTYFEECFGAKPCEITRETARAFAGGERKLAKLERLLNSDDLLRCLGFKGLPSGNTVTIYKQ